MDLQCSYLQMGPDSSADGKWSKKQLWKYLQIIYVFMLVVAVMKTENSSEMDDVIVISPTTGLGIGELG